MLIVLEEMRKFCSDLILDWIIGYMYVIVSEIGIIMKKEIMMMYEDFWKIFRKFGSFLLKYWLCK